MIARLTIIACLLFSAVTAAAADAERLYGVLDIELGMSFAHLDRVLDFRGIHTAVAQAGAGKPDLGRRGYGCVLRSDPAADIGCVSHDEKLDGVPTREIRLHFVLGRLQQFSLSAEVQHHQAVLDYLHKLHGQPREVAASGGDAAASFEWRSEAAHIVVYRGRDLVFVNFELANYAGIVKRRRQGVSLECS